MTLYDLLIKLTPYTAVNIVIYPRDVACNKIDTFTLDSNYLLDDICDATLMQINIEYMCLLTDEENNLPCLRVIVSAKYEVILEPLIRRIDIERERMQRNAQHN